MQYRPLKAAFFMIGASMLFVGMNLSAKLVPGNISSFEIAFFRSLVNFIVLLIALYS